MPRAMPGSNSAGPSTQALPGPGHYYDAGAHPAAMGLGAPAFTMGGRQATEPEGAGAQLPGPGQYYRYAALDTGRACRHPTESGQAACAQGIHK
jgi:hypothetical protein